MRKLIKEKLEYYYLKLSMTQQLIKGYDNEISIRTCFEIQEEIILTIIDDLKSLLKNC